MYPNKNEGKEINTEHVSKTGTGRGDQGRRKRGEKRQQVIKNIKSMYEQGNTLKNVKQHRTGEKFESSTVEHSYMHNVCTAIMPRQNPTEQRTDT
jgi:hypothetical protein